MQPFTVGLNRFRPATALLRGLVSTGFVGAAPQYGDEENEGRGLTEHLPRPGPSGDVPTCACI